MEVAQTIVEVDETLLVIITGHHIEIAIAVNVTDCQSLHVVQASTKLSSDAKRRWFSMRGCGQREHHGKQGQQQQGYEQRSDPHKP